MTVTFFAAAVSTSTDEHVAPVLAVLVIVGLLLVVAADLVAQTGRGAARAVRLRHR